MLPASEDTVNYAVIMATTQVEMFQTGAAVQA